MCIHGMQHIVCAACIWGYCGKKWLFYTVIEAVTLWPIVVSIKKIKISKRWIGIVKKVSKQDEDSKSLWFCETPILTVVWSAIWFQQSK